LLRNVLGKLVMNDRLLAYLSRIVGDVVIAGQQVALSSTQRVQLISWLNSNGVPADINKFKSNLISVDHILAMAEGRDVPVASPSAKPAAPNRPVAARRVMARATPPLVAPVMLGLGIDIQAKSKMPAASDHRTDPFYKRNFTERELAHCIEKADPLESFTGIWAAKEAILKAGGATRADNGELANIEILYDSSGAPNYAGCLLSISHEADIAVAVCMRCS
jgi:phosphopantetheine--protein transferase-like protein